MSDAAAPATGRPCSGCAHFVVDHAHPLHAALCDRLGGRLLSATAERRLDPPSCGPAGAFFVARGGT